MKRKIAVALSLLCSVSANATTTFINEIHYDNKSTDTGEFVEVVSPSDINIEEWSVVLYNGSNGTNYRTVNLKAENSRIIGAIRYTTIDLPGIQNGGPDGLVLLRKNSQTNSNEVVQFLSYEGQFTATDGPAVGLQSTDILKSESSSTPVGHSLQLGGSGETYSDFSWQDAAASTRNAPNREQSFIQDGQIDTPPTIIQVSPSQGETDVAADASIFITFNEPVVLTATNPIACDSESAIQTTIEGEGTQYSVIPASSFTAGDTCTFSINRDDVSDLDNAADNLEEDFAVTFSIKQELAPSVLVINEIHADPDGSLAGDANADGARDASEDEFVEIVNTSDAPVDLSAWTLADASGLRHEFSADGVLEPGCAIVVFGGGSPEAQIRNAKAVTASSGSLSLNNSGDTLTLTDGNAIAEVVYGSEASSNQSITRVPDVSGEEFKKHSEVSDGALYSPGTTADGKGFDGCVAQDLPPTVISISPLDNAVDVGTDTNVALTFNENVSVDQLPTLQCELGGNIALLQSGNGQSFSFTPAQELVAGDSCTFAIDAGTVSDAQNPADTIVERFESRFSTAEPLICEITPAISLISAVQGTGNVSPFDGQSVTIQGVVTSVLPKLNALTIQEELADGDGDPLSSEGIFVFNENDKFVIPEVGTTVTAQGIVSEFNGKTQLTLSRAPLNCGLSNDDVEIAQISLPLDSKDALEAFEGMRVENATALQVTDTFTLGRFGDFTLSNGRLYQPTNILEPGSEEAVLLAEANELNKLTLDDASNEQNPETVPFPQGNLSADNTLRLGSTVTSLSGVLDYKFGKYVVYEVQPTTFIDTNARTDAPVLESGNLTIASLNVLNYFTTIDRGERECGPSANIFCRGADDAGTDSNGRTEFERQQAKTVAAIAAINADVIGLMEVENNGFDSNSAIANLTQAVNAVAGENMYSYISFDSPIGVDTITVAIMYKPATVTPLGDALVLESSNSIADENGPLFKSERVISETRKVSVNRPSVNQLFALNENDKTFAVSVNHFKSKGSSCGDGDDSENGQGSCNLTRTRAAQGLIAFIDENFADVPVLVIGDLNAYAKEDPVQTFTDAGYTDLAEKFGGASAYSYQFRGQLGYLDHALANSALLDSVVDTTEWHINADEPVVLDYNIEFKKPVNVDNYYSTDPYRMSDHDPVVVSLQLDADRLIGDFDGDGDVDRRDYRALLFAIVRRQNVSLDFDLNNDGKVTVIDARLVTKLCTRPRCATR